MPRFLIDAHTVTTFWVQAENVEEATSSLRRTGSLMDPMLIDAPIVELVNFIITAEPVLIEIDCFDCGRCVDCLEAE